MAREDYIVTGIELEKAAGRLYETIDALGPCATKRALGLEGQAISAGKTGDRIAFGVGRSGKTIIDYNRGDFGYIIRAELDIAAIPDTETQQRHSTLTVACEEDIVGLSLADVDAHGNKIQYRFFINEIVEGRLVGLLEQLEYLQGILGKQRFVPKHI